jgi:hypothetical protein
MGFVFCQIVPSAAFRVNTISFVTVTIHFVFFADRVLILRPRPEKTTLTKPISDELLTMALNAMQSLPKSRLAAMSADERREYDRERQAAYREAKKKQMASGSAIPNEGITRDILADLAIMIIATDAVGKDTLMTGLGKYFEAKPGFPSQIASKIRQRKIRPKIIK